MNVTGWSCARNESIACSLFVNKCLDWLARPACRMTCFVSQSLARIDCSQFLPDQEETSLGAKFDTEEEHQQKQNQQEERNVTWSPCKAYSSGMAFGGTVNEASPSKSGQSDEPTSSCCPRMSSSSPARTK